MGIGEGISDHKTMYGESSRSASALRESLVYIVSVPLVFQVDLKVAQGFFRTGGIHLMGKRTLLAFARDGIGR